MIKLQEKMHSTPEAYDEKFNETLGISDMERQYQLCKYFKGGVYVDVGCFDSIMPIILAERYPKSKIYALDHAPKLIDFMRERFPKVQYIVGNAYYLPFEDESVDYIVAGEFIEHLENPQDFISECVRKLKVGGYLAISTPHEEKRGEVGGKYHMWSYTVDDVASLLGTKNVGVLQEKNSKSIIAWRKK